MELKYTLLALPLLIAPVQCCPREAVNCLDEVNAFRRENGVAELSLDGDLINIAAARLLVVIENYGHKGSGLYAHDALYRGECLCSTPEKQVAKACIWGWRNSLSHRNVLLDSRWTKAGIAAAKCSDGWTYFVLWLEE